MARFSVYRNPDGVGYLLDIQADLLSDLNTRVVVPLLPVDSAPAAAKVLNPVVQVDDCPLVVVTQFVAAVPLSMLKQPVGNLASNRDELTAAVDLLFQGF